MSSTVPMPFYVSVTAASSVVDPSVADPGFFSSPDPGSMVKILILDPHQRIYVF
jgi:hypothetical protein